MDWWERTKIGMAVGTAVGTVAGGSWVAAMLTAPAYPRQQGYAVGGLPPVDLAVAQRQWPIGATPQERQQLFGYVGNIEHASVPAASAPAAAAPAEAPVDLPTLLAAAQPDRGRRTAQACLACHNVTQGGTNGIGPGLWGVVGRPVASHAGFAYSPALRQHAGQWSYETLDRFLARPAAEVPGTKMAFAGIRNPRERANVLAYLATLGNAPPPPPPSPRT